MIELTYKDAAGHLGHELLFRDHEPTLAVIAPGRLWNFDADGALLRLVSEAYRIRLAYLSIPAGPSIPRALNRCPTRLLPSMARC